MSRFEKKDLIVSIAQKHDCNKEIFFLPRGNMSISQETNPQENPIFKPAHPQLWWSVRLENLKLNVAVPTREVSLVREICHSAWAEESGC